MKKIIALMAVLMLIMPIKCRAYSARAYTVIEKASGRVLYSVNGNVKMTMASTTKVMTALLACECLDLDKEYAIPDSAVGIEGSSIYLTHGERLTGRELLYGLMLASGNDAAYALAEIIGGSVDGFVQMMNDKARELRLNDTHFADPCGLKSVDHYTTSSNLAQLCIYALNNDTFASCVATQDYQIRGSKEGTVRYLHNKNRILGELSGGNGIKTGYTTASGRCLCSSATRNGMTLVCVVLNDYNWFEDSKQLLEKGFSEYESITSEKGIKLGTVKIYGGKSEKCDIISKDSFSYPIKSGERIESVTQAESFNAPVIAGEKAGVTEFFLNGEKIGEVDCVFEKSIEKKKKSIFG